MDDIEIEPQSNITLKNCSIVGNNMSITLYTNPFFLVEDTSISDTSFISHYSDSILFKTIYNSSFSHCSFLSDAANVSLIINATCFSDCVFNTSQVANVVMETVFENSSFILSQNSSFAGACDNSQFNLTAIDVNYTENRLFKRLTNVSFDYGVISNSASQDYDEDETEVHLVLADSGSNISMMYIFHDGELNISGVDSESIT